MLVSDTSLETIVRRNLDAELRHRFKERILEAIEPDIMQAVEEIMKGFETQIQRYRDNFTDKTFLEIVIKDKREPKS